MKIMESRVWALTMDAKGEEEINMYGSNALKIQVVAV